MNPKTLSARIGVYHRTMHVIGWLLMVSVAVSLLMAIPGMPSGGIAWDYSFATLRRSWMTLFLTGLASLWIAHFAAHLSRPASRPNWFVHHGSTLCYLCAVLVFFSAVSRSIYAAGQWPLVVDVVLLNTARVLILVGVAHVIKLLLQKNGNSHLKWCDSVLK